MSDEAPKLTLFNTIITWDVYIASYHPASATEAILELIRAGELSSTYRASLEMHVAPIRPDWRMQKALVAGDVSDADFEKLKGKTTQEVYDFLSKKQR